ncbi:MAG: bifunctional UDP-sugar hydrolase/5'-nucleotidase, partial [Hyphomicrobium sp.]
MTFTFVRTFCPVLIAALCFAFQSPAVTAGDPPSQTVEMTLAVFSDIYELAEKDGRGGFARIAGAVAAERAASTNVLIAHAGDMLSPSLMSSFDKGAHTIELLNAIRPDIFVPGNHEFDFGEHVFRSRMREAKFPLFAANLSEISGQPVEGFLAHKIFDIEGVKVGVFGLTDDESARRSQPGSLVLSASIPAARKQAEALRAQGADLIVAVSHSAWQDDIRLANLGVIDVVLSGHDHNLLVAYDGKTVIAESQSDGANLVAVDLTVTIRDGDKRQVTWTPTFRIIDTASVKPDKKIAARVAAYQAALDKDLDIAVGKTSTPLDSRKASVRGEETAIGNFIADAMLTATGADITVFNGGSIRGDRLYDAGTTLTRKDIFKELPFGNKVVMLELTGKDVREVLENAVRMAGKGDGRFGQIAGVRLTAKKDGVPGSKLTSVTIGGAPLDDARLYKVATNDFMALGKEGYDAFT